MASIDRRRRGDKVLTWAFLWILGTDAISAVPAASGLGWRSRSVPPAGFGCRCPPRSQPALFLSPGLAARYGASSRPDPGAKAWLVAMIKPAEQTWPAAALESPGRGVGDHGAEPAAVEDERFAGVELDPVHPPDHDRVVSARQHVFELALDVGDAAVEQGRAED